MSRSAFIAALFDHGRVLVPPPDSSQPVPAASEIRTLIAARAQELTLSFPGDPPDLQMDAALWAAEQLYRASQLVVYREQGVEAIARLLNTPCPSAPLAERHWSVDLTFSFLPDLILLAKAASEHDPLMDTLRQWANQWPLSSVGATDVAPQDIEQITHHAGLLQLYIDRILAKKDWSRLAHPRVRNVVLCSLGNYVSEWPELAQALKSWEPAQPH